jgi:hypothetical protein
MQLSPLHLSFSVLDPRECVLPPGVWSAGPPPHCTRRGAQLQQHRGQQGRGEQKMTHEKTTLNCLLRTAQKATIT